MAKKNIYAILDAQVQAFMNPLEFVNDGDAIRWFTTVVNSEKKETNLSLYPHQFTLFKLAEFDDQFGTFERKEKELIAGISVIDKKEPTVDELIRRLENLLDEKRKLTEGNKLYADLKNAKAVS